MHGAPERTQQLLFPEDPRWAQSSDEAHPSSPEEVPDEAELPHAAEAPSSAGVVEAERGSPSSAGVVEAERGSSAQVDDEDGQLALFAPLVLMRAELVDALLGGRFEEAVRVRDHLVEVHGSKALADDFDFLDELAGLGARPEPSSALAAWRRVAPSIERPIRRRQVRDALFLRLCATHPETELAALDPAALPDLVNALSGAGRGEAAVLLVREALLAGDELTPDDFEPEGLRDLLAEDREAPYLASLGAFRRLWAAPRPSAEELETLGAGLDAELPDDEAERGRDFWRCLRIAELRSAAPEPLLHAARRRMKRLDPELHALHMGH